MKHIVAVTGCPTGIAHTLMATEALKKTAEILGYAITIETHGAEGVKNQLSTEQIASCDVVIIASDIHIDVARFVDKPMYATSTSAAIRQTNQVIETAMALCEAEESEPLPPPMFEGNAAASHFFVAVTSCPTGIAHTFMAAEALKKAAEQFGDQIRVETQGSVGTKNRLDPADIARADAVIIAADTHVDRSRFQGKRILEASTKQALHDAKSLLLTAAQLPLPQAVPPTLYQAVKNIKAERSAHVGGLYRHLMTGVSYMLPMVVAGGLLIALAFALGGIYAGDQEGSLGSALMQIGGETAFSLFVPLLAGFIAFSIADRPGITPGMIGGLLATSLGSGFLGGIVAGFLAGYVTRFLGHIIRIPQQLEGLKPVLILPVISSLFVGLSMIYLIGPPVKIILVELTAWLNGLQDQSALLFGLVLGGMMAFDMGGPVNKAAYTFAVGLLASKMYAPMAAVMAAGMTPPLALALAATLFRSRFSQEEQEASKAAFILGIAFITEGAIPYAARDPFRVIPSIVIGSAVTGAFSMVSGVQLLVPHGGLFVLFIPHAVAGLFPYLLALVAGTGVSILSLYFLKKPLAQ